MLASTAGGYGVVEIPCWLDIRRLLPKVRASTLRFMSLKNAAFLALIGTLLLTILVAADFIKAVSGVLNDVVPAMALLDRSFICWQASA